MVTAEISPKEGKGIRLYSGVGDRALMIFIYTIMIFVFIIISVPLIFVIASSFSSPNAVSTGRVFLWPVEFSTQGYRIILQSSYIVRGFLMSIFYTVVGTTVNVLMTLAAAYPLSRKDLVIRGPVMFLFTLTMFINGGMIPTYLVVNKLNLINTVWAIILPSAMGVWNVILMRTYIQSNIPMDIFESASIDGCSDFKYLTSMVIPLSKPILAVMVLLYAVGRWNSFYDALMYINNRDLQPLQSILRSIIVQNSSQNFDLSLAEMMNRQELKNLLQYSLIVISSIPVMILYPFIQKYFIKGIMLGSLKG